MATACRQASHHPWEPPRGHDVTQSVENAMTSPSGSRMSSPKLLEIMAKTAVATGPSPNLGASSTHLYEVRKAVRACFLRAQGMRHRLSLSP